MIKAKAVEIYCDYMTGNLQGESIKSSQKKLGELSEIFEDKEAFQKMNGDEIVYHVADDRADNKRYKEDETGDGFVLHTSVLPLIVHKLAAGQPCVEACLESIAQQLHHLVNQRVQFLTHCFCLHLAHLQFNLHLRVVDGRHIHFIPIGFNRSISHTAAFRTFVHILRRYRREHLRGVTHHFCSTFFANHLTLLKSLKCL